MSGVIEDGLVDKLRASPTVTAVVSSRIYLRQAPQNATAPYIVVNKQPGQRDVHHSTGAAGISIAMVQVTCFSGENGAYQTARQTMELVRETIDGIGRGFFGSVFVMFCHRADSFDTSTVPLQDDEIGFPGYADLYRIGHSH